MASSKSPRTPRKAGRSKDDDSEDEELNEFDDEPGGYRIGDIYIPPPPPPPKYSGDATGTRLIITQIENINFKSYAGRQVIGPFHKSFTSIVGPNGSGKSNVIDSMLFVFGYRAQKLRSKKLNVLIHNSDTHPNCQIAQVIVHFALINDMAGENYELVAGSEFTVSRSVTKQNVLAYYINNKKVQYKEVAQLLQSHGIDLRYNRFLILQGEVEQIALMKPKGDENDAGMLEFLEDIIGSSRLKVPLGLLQEKVEETSVLRAEKLNRLKVVEKEKEVLEEAKNEAVKFLKTENELAHKRNQLFQLHKVDAVEARDEAQEEYEKAKSVYNEAVAAIDEIVKGRAAKEESAKEIQMQYTDVSKLAEETHEAFKELERKDLQVRNKIKHNKTKGKKLIEDIEKEKQRLEELKLIPEKCRKEAESHQKKKDELEEEKKDADDALAVAMSKIQQDTAPLQEEKERHEKQLLSLQKGVTEARSKLEVAQSELDLYLNKEKTEKSKLEQLNWRSESLKKQLEEKKTALKELEKQLPATEAEIGEIKKELGRLEQPRRELAEKLGKALEAYEDAKNQHTATSSRNYVLNALMEQKSLGNINGLLGRLGDLGGIDKKYDVAISTACGALDNLVTETMDDAQVCVQYLKANNVGAATFIGLDKMTRWESACRSRIQTPENVPRLFDLVRVKDERVKTAFYHALRDTLVADDLAQATRIGLKGPQRWRVVTLKGELVETSGAMSGGGRPSSGRMGTSATASEFSDEDIQNMERKAAQLKHQLQEMKTRHDELNMRGEQLTSDFKIMQQNLPKFKMEVDELQRQHQLLHDSINQQEVAVNDCIPDPKLVKSMETKVKKLDDEFEEASSVSRKIEEQTAELNAKIGEIMEKNVGTARKRAENLAEQLKKESTAVTKAGVSEKTAMRNIEKSEEKIRLLEKDIEETDILIANLKEEIKKIEHDAQEVTEKYATQTTERDEMQEKLKSLVDEINKMKAKESRLNSDNLDAKHEAEKLEKVFKGKDAEVKRWDEKIKGLSLHEIDGQEAPAPLAVYTKEEMSEYNVRSVQKDMEEIEKELKKMKPNLSAIAEYRQKEMLYLERYKEFEEATQRRDMLKQQHEQLRSQRMKEFKDGFMVITRKLKEMYRMITLGGDAELEWIDSLDPFSEGINFAVRPNKKSWKRISNLSGGEKTLSSLSLIFALHYFKPSPLYVMDEIDAALDFKNVSIVAHYIKQRTNNTQFIIISLRNDMYELANRLVGIYKTFNCTKTVTMNPLIIEAQKKKAAEASQNSERVLSQKQVNSQQSGVTTSVTA